MSQGVALEKFGFLLHPLKCDIKGDIYGLILTLAIHKTRCQGGQLLIFKS